MFRQRFAVPFLNKDAGEYNAARPPPLLGLRQGAVFVAKPLHDPSGDFAIVLYDPTVDDKPAPKEEGSEEPAKEEPVPEKLDEPIMHKSLAEILGLKKKVEERPRVPVVIDPRLAKVLRPHQVEGVKVRQHIFVVPHLRTDSRAVLIPSDDRPDRSYRAGMYHGGRDGPGKDTAMHNTDVDAVETIARCWEVDHSESRHRMSVQSGPKLG